MKVTNKLVIILMAALVLAGYAKAVHAAPHATVPGTYLEDFSRDTLLIPLGPGRPLNDGTVLYWNQFGNGSFSIQDSVLVAQCNAGGYYRFATSTTSDFAYCIFRIKGDARAKNNQIYTRIAAQGPTDSGGISDNYGTSERQLDTLVGPDSLPGPAITGQFQTIVVDMKKNRLSFGNGSDAFQIGTRAPMELDIDYIFMSNTNPLSVLPPSNLSYKHASVICTTGTAIAPDTAVVTGTVDSFAVAPALPAGLSLAKLTGTITGTPSTATAATNYTVTARNAAGTATVSLSITVNAALLPPSGLSYKHSAVICVTGTTITPDTATVTGSVDSFTVSPNLPAGLSIAKPTGIITGTPTTASAVTTYTVTARNAAGTATASLSITVNAALLPPSNFSYKRASVVCTTGTAITPDSAVVTGTVDSFTIAPGLPTGLSLAKVTGTITGTPSTATAATNYTVTARNAAGTATASVSITVYASVKAAIWCHDSSGAAPLTIQFIDTSSGSYSNRRWDFGDGTIDSASKSPSHTFSTAGTFIVKLAVWGNGGSDTAKKTIVTFTPGPESNPIVMAGKYLATNSAGDSQKVALFIQNVNSITPPVLVSVDSIGLWYTAGKIPTSPDSSTFRKKYSLATLGSQGGSQYADTLMVPAVPSGQRYYGFESTIYWSDQKGKPMAFSSGNGVLVLMKDTVAPANNLTLTGTYLPKDTARLSIGNISGIDTSMVDSMFVWYSLTTDSADFTDKTLTKGLSAAEVKTATAGNQYPFYIVNGSFFSSKKTIYCAVVLRGKNDIASGVKKYQFIVGLDRPANPIVLHAKALTATQIQVSWNNISAAGVDRIVVWYRKLQPVDTVYDVSALNLDSLVPASLADMVIIGNNFNEQTRYYFGAQVFKGGLWSQITAQASASDSTPAAGAKLDSAVVKALHLLSPGPWFDTSSNTLRIGWTVNRSAVDSLDIGISYSTVSAAADTVVRQVIVQPAGASDSVAVTLYEDLAFNSLYYVKLWLRRPSGKWTDPGDSCGGSVKAPAFTWQSVIYFTKATDSVYAFNREIRLMNQAGDQSKTQNRVRYFAPPSLIMAGFTQVGTGFEFSVKDRGYPFYIGFKVDSVPQGFRFSDVRIYRDSAGLLLLSREPVSYDSANRYVSVLTNDLDFPFVALVDKTGPSGSTPSNTTIAVPAGQAVTDTVAVHDNIANCTWRYLYARGGDAFDTTRKISGMLHDTIAQLVVTIDSNYVTQDNGVRALLIIDDGMHYDTVVLSRRVLRDGSDIAFTDEQKWTPLCVTADLDTPDAKTVLRELPAGGGSAWKYDDTKFRIFRCYPAPGQAEPWKWVEYADTIAGEFGFTRGNIIWVKTLKQSTVRYGHSTTPSLSTVFPIRILPQSWMDFSVPFKFDINVGDILAATSGGDSLEFYTWQRDMKTHEYFAELLFMKAMLDLHFNNGATPLSSSALGYTIYNPTQDTVVMNVPPLPVAMSKQGLQKKNAGALAGWTIRVASSAEDGSSLSSVYLGYAVAPPVGDGEAPQSGGVSYYPLSPSFGSVHAGVSDEAGKKVYGVAIAHAMQAGGCAYLLTFVNDGQTSRRIYYHCEGLSPMPHGMTMAVWNGAKGMIENFAQGNAAVAVAPGSREYRTLLVGDAGYLAKARLLGRPMVLALVGTYPNPFRSAVHIRYSVPYADAGVKIVKFTIYNLSGKVVWRHEVKDLRQSGASDLVWNATGANGRPVAAGIYVLRMTAQNSGLKQVGAFERKMTLMP